MRTRTKETIYGDIKNGHSVMVYEQNNLSEANGGVKDKRLDNIGKTVEVEHGTGKIVAVELFPTSFKSNAFRYLVEITNNHGKEVLKSLFPNNRLCYWADEITFKD